MTARLLAVLPRGEAIRNFVWHGGLQSPSSPFQLAMLSVRPSDAVWDMIGEHVDEVVELVDDVPGRWVRRARELLWSAHNATLGNEASRYRLRSHRSQASSSRARAKVEFWRLAGGFVAPLGMERLAAYERRISRRLDRSVRAPEVLATLEPDVVFNASEVHSDNAISVMQVASWMGLPTATFLFSWDNLTSQRRLLVPADRYLVWNQSIRTDLLTMYPAIDSEQVVVTGSPQFDPHFSPDTAVSREVLCERFGLEADRPIVLYTTGMPNHMPGEPDLVQHLHRSIERRFGPKGPQLVVRVYAKDRTGRFDRVRGEAPGVKFVDPQWEPQWLTPLPEDTRLWTSLLAHADVGVNVASTVSLELCMFDKPVINVAFNPPGVPDFPVRYSTYYAFDHYRPVVESGAVELVESLDCLVDAIDAAITRPDRAHDKRSRLVESMFGDMLDGRSGERVVAALAELLP